MSLKPTHLWIIQVVWVLGYLVGTTTHVADLVVGGSEPYAGFPTAVRVFWVSLTVIDPLTAVLLVLRRRLGVVLGVVVILADLAVNWTVFAMFDGLSPAGLVNLTAFGAVVVATASPLWAWFGGPAGAGGPVRGRSGR
jgi:hypothetical protein